MAGRYIPPHMRGTSISSVKPTQTPERDPEKGYSSDEISNQFNCKVKLGTLNSAGGDGDSGFTQESLSFIIIFKDQHPEWPPKIFCKSNLHLLPSTPAQDTDVTAQPLTSNDENVRTCTIPISENPTSPSVQADGKHGPSIAVFSQIRTNPPMFIYDGARSIKSVAYIQPMSAELIRMLEMKFGPQRKERAPESWQSSLSMKWVIVEMGELEESKNPMVPFKKMKNEKSVTEMLREMRVRDSKEAGGGDGDADGKIGEKCIGEKQQG